MSGDGGVSGMAVQGAPEAASAAAMETGAPPAARPDGRRAVVLMTAAIDVHRNMPHTTHRDPEARRDDYRAALAFYVARSPAHVSDVVFCENTGADLAFLDPYRRQAAANGVALHAVGFTGTVPPRRGKGVAELEIMDRAHDFMAARLPPDTIVFKTTGRLIVENLEAMIESYPEAAALYFDARALPFVGDRFGGNNWIDTRMFAFTLAGYRDHIHGSHSEANRVIEKFLFRRLKPVWEAAPGRVQPRLLRQPLLAGRGGLNGSRYDGPRQRAKDALRAAARRIAPGLWL